MSCYSVISMGDTDMAEMDKVTRILMIYSKLLEGGKIYKRSFCADTGINRRTFDRDIEDIRIFFSEAYMGYELVYDRNDESYHLENYHQQVPLSPMEVSFLMVLVRSVPVLRKDEYMQLVSNMIKAGTWSKQNILIKIAVEQFNKYQQDEDRGALLKIQWDLQQCIFDRDIIRLHLSENKRLNIAPMELKIHQKEIFLIGYDIQENLFAIPLNRIESFKFLQRKYNQELEGKFCTVSEQMLKEKMEEMQEDEKIQISIEDEGQC